MKCIAIDGPSGSGKSTVAKILADKLGFTNINTGSLYRAIAYYLKSNKINCDNVNDIGDALKSIHIKMCNEDIFVNDQNVTNKIRSEEISIISSKISSYDIVRKYLLEIQREIAKNNNVIMDGRDIGTVVMPNADIKIFLTAKADVRAKRRFNQLNEKNIEFSEVLDNLNKRDYEDMNRSIAPLKIADDAVVFDNSEYDLKETVEKLLCLIKERL